MVISGAICFHFRLSFKPDLRKRRAWFAQPWRVPRRLVFRRSAPLSVRAEKHLTQE